MGTPTDDRWQGVSQLPNYMNVQWTMHPPQELKTYIRHMETLEDNGLDLLYKMLEYDPTQRISAV